MSESLLTELQQTLERDIPICALMGIRVEGHDERGLRFVAPLEKNLNHQQTAFAGTLSTLCTITGWGAVFLLTRAQNRPPNIVIRRSTIKYLKPVTAGQIVACCREPDPVQKAHFDEMLQGKGQSKIDLHVEIRSGDELAVSFHGSYVVLEAGALNCNFV